MRSPCSDRKLRLFACACCRSIWHLLTDARSRRAIEVAELFADEPLEPDVVKAAEKNAGDAIQNGCDSAADAAQLSLSDPFKASLYGAIGASCAVRLPAWRGQDYASEVSVFAAMSDEERNTAIWSDGPKAARTGELEKQVSMLRDIMGNPFRSVSVEPAWLVWNGGTIPTLAEAIYEDRHFDRLPILADALEDAGCENADILAHLRNAGPHVRGCWPVDLILGKG